MTQGNQLVLFRRFFSSIDAHLLKMKLESEGIEAFLFDDRSMGDPLDASTGGVRVMIRNSDLGRAFEIAP